MGVISTNLSMISTAECQTQNILSYNSWISDLIVRPHQILKFTTKPVFPKSVVQKDEDTYITISDFLENLCPMPLDMP